MHLLLVIVFTRALVTCNEKLHSSHAAASTFKVCARKQNLLTLRIACHKQFGQIKMKILWYSSRHTLIYRKKDGKPRMISGQFVAVRVGSTNSSSLHTPLILCFKSAVSSCMGIARPVWTARTYDSHPRCPWKALSNWAVNHLNKAVNEISLDHPPQSDTIGKHTIEQLDSWPKPVELQRFMSTFSVYSPVSGRPLHT